MKDSVTIKKSEVEKLGKDLMKEIDIFLHDDYIVKDFPELNPDRENFDNSKNRLKDKFESESLSMEEIYNILLEIKLDFEIEEDVFCKKESYLNLYKVLFYGYMELESYKED